MLNLFRTITSVWHKTLPSGSWYRNASTQVIGYRISNILTSTSLRFLSTVPQPSAKQSEPSGKPPQASAKQPRSPRKYKGKDVIKIVNQEIKKLPQSFAVVYIGGHQFKITNNDIIVINRIEADVGSDIILNKVLSVGSKNFTLIGRPLISDRIAKVSATILEHTKTPKVIVFKKKRRKNYKRTKGHRQNISVLRINDIELRSELS